MSFHLNINKKTEQQGSALVAAVIVLALLTALGFAALNVADLNINISANDRDSKESFFHADAGANVGHEFLEEAIENVNSYFYNSDANTWTQVFDSKLFPLKLYSPSNLLKLYTPTELDNYNSNEVTTHVRAGESFMESLAGEPLQMAAGYEDPAMSIAHGGAFIMYIIRSHRIGERNSVSEIDLGWRHVL